MIIMFHLLLTLSYGYSCTVVNSILLLFTKRVVDYNQFNSFIIIDINKYGKQIHTEINISV